MHKVRQVVDDEVALYEDAVVIALSPVVNAAAEIEAPAFTTETLELNLDIGNNK